MKRFILPALFSFVIAVTLLGCGESKNPFEASECNERSVMPVMDVGPGGGSMVVDLSAGDDCDIGTVTCRLEDDMLYFDYATEGGWLLVATHLDIKESLEDIPLAWCGMPKLHLFPFKKWYFPFVTEYSYAVDIMEYGISDAVEVFAAAHAFAVKLSERGWIEQIASAWGEGECFPKPPLADEPVIRSIEMYGGLDAISEDERLVQIIPDDQRAFMEMEGYGWEDLFRISRPQYFVVNIQQLRGLILWNKLGSVEEVENSKVGPDGVIVGDIEYLPCQHGNGFKPLPRTGDHNIPDNYIKFSGLNLGQQGCIEFWYHPDWIDWRVGHQVQLFDYGFPSTHPDAQLLVSAGYNDWQDLFHFATYHGPGDSANRVGIKLRPSATPGWSTSEPFHMAFMWDGTKLDPQDRIKIFINGNPVGSFWVLGDPTFNNYPSDALMYLGSRIRSGDWNRHRWEDGEGIIDNIKIWSYPKTDFSDRFEE